MVQINGNNHKKNTQGNSGNSQGLGQGNSGNKNKDGSWNSSWNQSFSIKTTNTSMNNGILQVDTNFVDFEDPFINNMLYGDGTTPELIVGDPVSSSNNTSSDSLFSVSLASPRPAQDSIFSRSSFQSDAAPAATESSESSSAMDAFSLDFLNGSSNGISDFLPVLIMMLAMQKEKKAKDKDKVTEKDSQNTNTEQSSSSVNTESTAAEQTTSLQNSNANQNQSQQAANNPVQQVSNTPRQAANNPPQVSNNPTPPANNNPTPPANNNPTPPANNNPTPPANNNPTPPAENPSQRLVFKYTGPNRIPGTGDDADDVLEDMADAADKNDDDKLSRQELINQRDKYVGKSRPQGLIDVVNQMIAMLDDNDFIVRIDDKDNDDIWDG